MNNERRSEIAKMLARNILLSNKKELHQAATELLAENEEVRAAAGITLAPSNAYDGATVLHHFQEEYMLKKIADCDEYDWAYVVGPHEVYGITDDEMNEWTIESVSPETTTG